MKLLIGVAIVVAILLLFALLWVALRGGGIRRAEFGRAKAERDLALRALDKIEAAADTYRDIDSVLATEVRRIVREDREARRNLVRTSREEERQTLS